MKGKIRVVEEKSLNEMRTRLGVDGDVKEDLGRLGHVG